VRYNILDRFTKEIRFAAIIDCDASCDTASKIGTAVDYAIDNKISLIGTDLKGGFLGDIDLTGIDMRGADLRGAYMNDSAKGAIMKGADISITALDNELRVLTTDIWTCYIAKDCIQIGCKFFMADELFNLSDEEVASINTYALTWWEVWKPIVKSINNTLKRKQMNENFNLARAMAGDPIQTIGGVPVEFVAYRPTASTNFQVVVQIENVICCYPRTGYFSISPTHEHNLCMK
jgi:hypothetical protein